MEIRYEVPKHLENYISPMTEEDLSKLLTILFEIAVRHRMFDYPSLAIERDIRTLVNEISSISQSNKLINSTIGNYHTALNNKIDNNNANMIKILETIKNIILLKIDNTISYNENTNEIPIIRNNNDAYFELPDNDDDIIY